MGTVLTGLAYAGTDGGSWLGGAWGKLIEQRALFMLLFGVWALAAAAVALFTDAGSRSRTIGGMAATAVAASLIGATGFGGKLASGLEAAD